MFIFFVFYLNNLIESNIFTFDHIDLSFERIIFFNIHVNDESNVYLKGQTVSYCWDTHCTLPAIKSK